MLLSIIIAAFNVESYIADTMKAIIGQMTDDCELIVINDGSKDGTKAILEKYEKEKNVLIINQNNQGVSRVRNTGLLKAKGKYIWFVDGDDSIDNRSIANVIEAIINNDYPDIIFCNYTVETKKESYLIKQIDKTVIDSINDSSIDSLKNILWSESHDFNWSVWSNIYSVSFLKNNNLYFNPELIYNEDGDWFFNVLEHVDKFGFIYESIYKYNKKNTNSITTTNSTLKKYLDNYYTLTKWFDYYCKLGKKNIVTMIANQYLNAAVGIYNIQNKADRQEAKKHFMQRSDIVYYSSNLYAKFYSYTKMLPTSFQLKMMTIIHNIMGVIKKGK